jgi:hypothetical protein
MTNPAVEATERDSHESDGAILTDAFAPVEGLSGESGNPDRGRKSNK